MVMCTEHTKVIQKRIRILRLFIYKVIHAHNMYMYYV